MSERNGREEERALDRPREYPVALSSYQSYPEEELHIRDYLQVILRRKWIVITFFIAVVTTVTIGTFLISPQYKAGVTIRIDKENPNILSFKEVYAVERAEEDYYQTQYKVLKSRNLARRVIRLMKLDLNPEFAKTARQEKGVSPVMDLRKPVKDDIDSALIDRFISRIDVAPEQKSRLVRVSFISYDPQLSARVADTLARAFIDLNIESKFEATQQAREWLERQLDDMKAKVEQAEEKLNDYAAKNGIIFLDKEGKGSDSENIITKRLSELSTQLTAATGERITREALNNEIRSGDPDSSSAVLSNPLIQVLKKDYASLESEYNQNLKTYKPDYPKMVRSRELLQQLQRRISEETKKIVVSARKDYEAALKRENYLRSAFEKNKADALELNNRSVQYLILKREADTNKELYNGLLQRLKETGISASLTSSNIQVLDRAEVPKYPFKPNKAVNMLLSVFVGLLGGVGLAFFADYLDNTVKTPTDVEKKVFMPSLGLVPLYNRKPKEPSIEHALISGDNRLLAEAYSSIRTFLLFATAGRPPKVMMVTSSKRDEGKSTTCVNTAVSLTKSNAKVVIVDADLRRPKAHKIFKVSNKSGLSSFLSGNEEFGGNLVRKTEVPGLYVLPAGPVPPNPAELLGSYRLRDLIDGLYPLYDYILFDTPPLLGIADAAITSTHTDGVIMVIRSGHTAREAALQARKILESVNAKILGVVLNGISAPNMKYGSSYSYNYYSEYYSGNESK